MLHQPAIDCEQRQCVFLPERRQRHTVGEPSRAGSVRVPCDDNTIACLQMKTIA